MFVLVCELTDKVSHQMNTKEDFINKVASELQSYFYISRSTDYNHTSALVEVRINHVAYDSVDTGLLTNRNKLGAYFEID